MDTFFAPIAFRIQTYGLDMSPTSPSYLDLMLKLAGIIAWRDAANAESFRELAHDAKIGELGECLQDYRA